MKAKQAEADNCRTALRQAKAERERIMQLMLSDRLTDANAPLFSAKLTAADAEVERLESRLEQLKAECNIVRFDPDLAMQFIRELETIADVMTNLPMIRSCSGGFSSRTSNK